VQWTVVIPVKALPGAKSRLLAATADRAAHHRLVQAIREDTLAAARAASDVARVVLVADRPGALSGAGVSIVQSAPGLNPALREAAGYAAARWPADGVAALVGDLPALRPEELTAALRAAAAHQRSYVADADATGTTLLAALPGHPLRPRFGAGSAARHAVDAVALCAGPGLRRDVDTAADLRSAASAGLGPATSAALAASIETPAVHLDPA